jgi:putative MATE family efflux protein
MQLSTSYKQIWLIAFPIMLGSAAQNIIALSDSIFLYHYNSSQFAAIGIIGSFYLILASIGYGFSRGGQIFIARKYGEKKYGDIGVYFQALLFFELLLSALVFFLVNTFSSNILKLFVASPELIKHCSAYLKYRMPGIFFSFTGVVLIALYTAIADTKIILYDTIILGLSNVILNVVLIYGYFGLPEMGIAGSALASTISEVIAFAVFILYMVYKRENLKQFNLFKIELHLWQKIKDFFSLSFPLVLQSAIGLSSYFIFFTLIENNSEKDLQISNLIRTVYLILSIPAWGFSAGINTMVSNLIGNNKRQGVIPIIKKTSLLSFAISMAITLPVVFYPEYILHPLFGSEKSDLLIQSKPYMMILLPIIGIFSIGSIFYNGLTGTGHTKTALLIQSIFTCIYILFCVIAIKYMKVNLYWAWSGEWIYWIGICIAVYLYLKTKKWHFKII